MKRLLLGALVLTVAGLLLLAIRMGSPPSGIGDRGQVEGWGESVDEVSGAHGEAAGVRSPAVPDLDTEASWDVRVSSRSGDPGGWRPVLGINTAGGTKPANVTTPSRAAGARFCLHLESDPPGVFIAEGVLDDQGRGQLTLTGEGVGFDGEGGCNLVGSLVEPGLQRRIARARRHKNEEGILLLSLHALEGTTRSFVIPGYVTKERHGDQVGFVRGTVRDPYGDEVEGLRPVGRCVAIAGDDGQTLVHFPGEAEVDLLYLDGGALGSAALPLTDSGRELPVDEPTYLELKGAGRIHGTLAGSDGTPLAFVALDVHRLVPGFEFPARMDDQPLASDMRRRGSGRWMAKVNTGPTGNFEVTGLCPGDYAIDVLAATDGLAADRQRVRAGEATASSDSTPISLLYEGPLFFVRVEGDEADNAGQARGGEVEIHEAGPVGTAPWVRSALRASLGRPVQPLAVVRFDAGSVGHTMAVPIRMGGQFVVRAEAGEMRSNSAVVQSGGTGAGSLAVLSLSSPAATGVIDLTVNVAGSRPRYDSKHLQTLADVHDGLARFIRTGENEVDPGTYRVSAFGFHEIIGNHGGVTTPRRLGRASQVVTVGAGRTVPVVLELREGGRVRVEVRGRVSERERLAEERRYVESLARRSVRESLPRSEEAVEAALGSRSRSDLWRVELFLVNETERYVVPLYRAEMYVPEGEDVPQLLHASLDWPLGETHDSTVLPAGDFTLRARMRGRPDVRVPVTITAGETTEVTVDLGR